MIGPLILLDNPPSNKAIADFAFSPARLALEVA